MNGLAEAGHNFYMPEGAMSLQEALRSFTGGRIADLVAATPFKCPAARYEAALLIERHLRDRGLRDSGEVSVYSPEPGSMGVADPEMSAAVRQMAKERGISYYPRHQISEVDSAARSIRFANGAAADLDLLAYGPPHIAPGVVIAAGMTNESGWVPVDLHTMETAFEGVYAIGDVTTIPLSMGLPLPKAGTFAHGQAHTVARRIAATIKGQSPDATSDGHGECFIEIGRGRAAMGVGNFYAQPAPTVKLRQPGRMWHLAKLWFEWRWLRKWF